MKLRTARRFRSTARRTVRRRFPWRPVLLILGVCLVSITAALIVGGILSNRADAAEQDTRPEDVFTLPPADTPAARPVPAFRGHTLAPGASPAPLTADVPDSGAVLVCSPAGDTFPYDLPLLPMLGLTAGDDAPTLASECTRLRAGGLRSCGVMPVTCFIGGDDPAVTALLRGRELSLALACAEAGLDELLLTGLPCGTDSLDSLSVGFLTELRRLIAEAGCTTAVGAALMPDAFLPRPEELNERDDEEEESPSPVYAGSLTPARILSACDFLALDLRGQEAEEADSLLYGFRYAYVRFSLRLVCAEGDSGMVSAADRHGFARVTCIPFD